MIPTERTLFRTLRFVRMLHPLRSLLRSNLAWRVAGLTYATSVIATTGSYGSRRAYLSSMRNRMQAFRHVFKDSDTVLEFGSGLGGNLLAVASWIGKGVGLDINPWFVARARGLQFQAGITNVSFRVYDGRRLPGMGCFDVEFAFGPFERIGPRVSMNLLSQLAGVLKEGGCFIGHFLTRSSVEKGFTRLLGEDAYTIWETEGLQRVLAGLDLVQLASIPDFPSPGVTLILRKGRASVGDAFLG